MINFFVQMKLNNFAYLYSKPLGNHTLKIMKKIPGNLLKRHGNIMEFCQSEKVGTLHLSLVSLQGRTRGSWGCYRSVSLVCRW